MDPTDDRPVRRRLTEEKLRATLAHNPLTIDEVREVTRHKSLVMLLDYRRDPARKRPLDERGTGLTPQRLADDVTGHRSADTASMYIRQHNPFEQDPQDADGQ